MKQIKTIIFDADRMLVRGERFSKRFSEKYKIDIKEINQFF